MKVLMRRWGYARTSAVLGLLALSACGTNSTSATTSSSPGAALVCAPGTTTDVRVAAVSGVTVTKWPLQIADKEGFFKQQGINVAFTNTFQGEQLLAGGQVDVIASGAQNGLLAAAQGAEILEVAPISSYVTDGILVAKSVHSVADLSGKALRVSAIGATDDYLLRKYLDDHGLPSGQVTVVAVDDDGVALTQLQAGQIAGGMFDQGFLYTAKQSGQQSVLATPSAIGRYPWNVLQTTRGFATSHGSALSCFIRAELQAMKFIQNAANQQAVIKDVVASEQGATTNDVTPTYVAAAANYPGFNLYSQQPLTTADLGPAVAFLKYENQATGSLDLNKVLDNSYFSKAQG